MKKLHCKEDLFHIRLYPREVIEKVESVINILNDNYGVNRNIFSDLGGYIIIIESIKDVELLKIEKLNGIIPEYTEIIECSEEAKWTSSLFLLSSDYSIVVITTEELSKHLLE